MIVFISSDELGEFQKAIIHFELLTSNDIACLYANRDPSYHHIDDTNYRLALRMVDLSIEAGSLRKIDDTDYFSPDDVRHHLIKKDWIFEGFNDEATMKKIDEQKLLTPLQSNLDEHARQLSDQLNQTKADNDELQAENDRLKTEITELQNCIADLETQLKQAQSSQPKRTYTTPAIEAMEGVIKEFWQDYDPDTPAPKQDTIKQWLLDNFDAVDSNNLALSIDKVCRHPDKKKGGLSKFN